jgi:hypothetical protein
MKNTFKYIAALVALLSGFAVYAQNLETDTYEETNGGAYAKRAILNNDGTYTIKLETFVTGEVTETHESVPADVVLVLDVSGSMDDSITNYEYSPATVSSITGNDIYWGTQSTGYYYKYEDSYYELFKGVAYEGGWSSWNTYYYLSFTVGGTTLYINTSGQVVADRPSNVTDADTNLLASNVQLYSRRASGSMTKLAALQMAVNAFLAEINKNDRIDPDTEEERDERLGNRIAIVAFSGAQYAGQSTHDNSIQLNTGWVELGENKDIDDSTGYDSLIEDVSNLYPTGGTHVEYGMQDALALIQASSADVRTVVLFTDGIPGTGTWGERETTNSANDAIEYSRQINAITIGSGDNATTPKIYAVGLFDEKPQSGTNTYNYMNYVCSNYPNARSMNNAGTQDSDDFYLDASGGSAEDLKDIFTAIAHASGGSGNTDVSGGSTLTVDVVSSSFSVPTGFESASDVVSVTVAPCVGKTTIGGKEYLTFGEEKAPAAYGLDDITPVIDEEKNTVSTSGFDYSANWCGPDPTSTSQIQPGYHGFKQIITFIITVNDDAVGGPAVETNDSDSGIYLPGETKPLITFNRPTVKLPVQIWIQKQGLRPGDSAVFTLAMCKFTDWDPNQTDLSKQKWSSFTKVVINYSDMDQDGIVKIVGLDPDYFYRLKEDAWAFGYTYQDGGINYTVGDNVQNPFIFKNEPKDLKFDEASARNIFNEKTAE